MEGQIRKPLLRGHFHQAMFFILLGACATLMAKSSTAAEAASSIIYSLCALLMFGVSALYHRVTWPPKARSILRRLDHSVIFLMIAGTFTPLALLLLPPQSASTALLTIWTAASLGIAKTLLMPNTPKLLNVAVYLLVGYLIIPFLPKLANPLGKMNLIFVVGGGALYSLGALCYGLKFPKLKPHIFGYHEVFHVLVAAAAILHFVVIFSLI